MLLDICQSVNMRKNGQKSFFFGTIAFLLKNLILDSLGPKNWSFNLHKNCQLTFRTPIKSFLRFVILDNTRKIGELGFFIGRIAFFSKVCVFNKFVGPTERILRNPQWLLKHLVDLMHRSLRFLRLDITRKNYPKFLVTGKIDLMKYMVPDFLGLQQMIT